MPFTAVIATFALFADLWADRVGPRVLIVAGLGLVAGGLVMLAVVGPESGVTAMAPGVLITGIGLGIASAPVTTTSLALVPSASRGAASATISVSRLVRLAIGVVAMGAILSVGWPSGTVGSPADRSSFANVLGAGFLISAAFALLGSIVAIIAVRLPPARLESERNQ